VILQPVRRKKPAEDDSFTGMRVGVLLLAGLGLFLVLAFRLWYLQILSGDAYVGFSKSNRERTVTIEAPRGFIYDRNEQALVQNRAGLSVGLLAMDMPDPEDEEQKAEFDTEISKLANLLGMTTDDVLSEYGKAKKDQYVTHVIKEDVSEEDVVAYIKEHSEDFPGVEIEKTYLREYPYDSLAAHLLGYVGEVSPNDLDQTEFSQLAAGTHIGKDGVERTYDSYLRGTDGYKKVTVNASGQPVAITEDEPAETGYNLVLTIDAKLQEAAETALVKGIQRAHDYGYRNADAGAVVALDPRNGEILAMASYPTYDPTVWVGGISQDDYAALTSEESANPLFDRALSGLYPAGSTFKPFVASVALDAGVTTPDRVVYCSGSYTVSTSTFTQLWKCWLYPEKHGDVRLLEAIEQSCDVYFYTMGYEFYQKEGPVLQDGLRLFGFGRQTGIDLPGETTGSRVPDVEWARDQGQEWKTGDEINLAIGQGDLLITPLQEAVALGALVNGGTVWVPHLCREIKDSSMATINSISAEKRGDLGIDQAYLDEVMQGMRLVVQDPSGTAYNTWWGFPVSVGGKTGTAEKKPDEDYSLFMGYAPADPDGTPEIVVVALIEQGGHGNTVAAPMVRYVMESYFGIEHTVLGNVAGTE
jgi:penicillin-binding protein 2